MLRIESIYSIISKQYKRHSSLFLTRDVKNKDAFFYNFDCPKQTQTLVDTMNALSLSGELKIHSIEAKLYNKIVSPYKCEDYIVKVSEHKGPNSYYISASFYGITGVDVKKAYGKYEAKLSINPKHLLSIYINATNGDLYGKGVNNRESLYPMAFSSYVNKLLMQNDAFRDVFKDILMLCSNGRHIVKDIVRTIDEEGYVAMPITIFDIKKYRTKDDMIRGFTGSDLPIDFNKRSLNHGYLLTELSKNIPPEQYGYMIQLDKEMVINTVKDIYKETYPLEFFVREFIVRYYINKLGMSNTRENRMLILDYIRLAKDHELPVSINFKTVNRLLREHNMLARRYCAEKMKAETSQPLIAEDTRFSELRHLLPDEFEWITDTGRLFAEGELQHNCVFSYRDMVRDDRSAIYHWSIDDRQYTIEFGRRLDGRFTIKQMLQANNREARTEDVEYVKGCLGDRYAKHSEELFTEMGDYLGIPERIDDVAVPF